MATATQPELVMHAPPLYATPLDPSAVQPGADLVLSRMDRVRLWPREKREAWLGKLTEEEKISLPFTWNIWARPNQLLPTVREDWVNWFVQAGRGYGKTRTGVETVREWIRTEEKSVRPGEHIVIHVIAPTNGDLNKVILDGPAGFIACCDPREIISINRGTMTICWANGAKVLLFSAEEPERLRGPQCHKLWCDELAAWKYPERTWDNAVMGLRLGLRPQSVITTTPKPIPLIKKLVVDPNTVVTRGATYENKHNLAPTFWALVVGKYQGTRYGRQELYAEILADNPGALWNYTLLEELRREKVDRSALRRIVIGVDPSASDNETSDECGIVAVGEGPETPPHYYILEDRSLVAHPNTWARAVVQLYHDLGADCVVAEKNNGGQMVAAVMHNVDRNLPVRLKHASRGKITRAEPIAALYEQKRCHHVGNLALLESQMCEYDPATADDSPDRMDALVWAMTELSARGNWFVDMMREGGELLGVPSLVNAGQPPKTLEEAQKKNTPLEGGWFAQQAEARNKKVIAQQFKCTTCGNVDVALTSEAWRCNCGASGRRAEA